MAFLELIILIITSFSHVKMIRAAQDSTDCPFPVFTWVNHGNDPGENEYFWKSPDFDWNCTATLAVFGDITDTQARIEMRDYALSLGKVVVAGTGTGDIDMNNKEERKIWIQNTIDYAQSQGLTGINMDYEGHKPSLTTGYNDLLEEFCNEMHLQMPGSKVSVDVPIYPEYEGRNYDYSRIAKSCDSLFIMAYDGEFWDNIQCVVTQVNCSLASAPIDEIEFGIQKYIEIGVPTQQLILGVPWYGLKYDVIAKIPFFFGQIDYKDILDLIEIGSDAITLSFNEISSTWKLDCGGKCSLYSNVIDDATTFIIYDDPKSLAPKYKLASTYNIGGVGMWEATHLYYDVDKSLPDTKAMWDAMSQRN